MEPRSGRLHVGAGAVEQGCKFGDFSTTNPSVVWVIPSIGAGGIGSVCSYTAETVSKHFGWRCTVLCLHDPHRVWTVGGSSVRFVAIGMPLDEPQGFLAWLRDNPHNIVITNDVSSIEVCFPFFPREVIHVVQLHDSGRRYLDIAIRNRETIDGVLCVARNIESKLREGLENMRFQGLIGTVHNGAKFPAPPSRQVRKGPLRLLFMGRMEPLSKGLFDLVPVLRRVEKMGVQLSLRIAGGRHRVLEARFMRQRLDHLVTWMGIVPHEECYRLAAESDMLLMTSRREPFGMVTIEAMAMGCVPIAYDIPSGNREIIEHWRSGLLLPLGDFEAWANSIKSLDEDRHLLSKMSEAAVARARSNFNADKLAQGISNLIRAVKLNSAKDPPRRYVGAPGPRTAAAISYSRLPAWFRQWIRNTVSNHPYLSWWWLNQL